ncbi:hypothetical protein RYX36_015486 [Vicia faba]
MYKKLQGKPKGEASGAAAVANDDYTGTDNGDGLDIVLNDDVHGEGLDNNNKECFEQSKVGSDFVTGLTISITRADRSILQRLDAEMKAPYLHVRVLDIIISFMRMLLANLKEESVRAGAVYERKYLLGTAATRPVIAKPSSNSILPMKLELMLSPMVVLGKEMIRHVLLLLLLLLVLRQLSMLNLVAPWRDWDITGREDAIEFAKKHNVPIPGQEPLARNNLDDPANEPKKDLYMLTADPQDAPNQLRLPLSFVFRLDDYVSVFVCFACS